MFIKTIIIFLALLIISSSFLKAQYPAVNSKTEKEIRKMLDAQLKTINDRNFEEFMAYFWSSDDFTFTVNQGVLQGIKDFRAYQEPAFKDEAGKSKMSYKVLTLKQITDKTVLLVGQMNVEMTDASKNFSYHFSCLLTKEGKNWLTTAETISIDKKAVPQSEKK